MAKKKGGNFITYSSRDEILVTTKKREAETLAVYFNSASGRDLSDYEREEVNGCTVRIDFAVNMKVR